MGCFIALKYSQKVNVQHTTWVTPLLPHINPRDSLTALLNLKFWSVRKCHQDFLKVFSCTLKLYNRKHLLQRERLSYAGLARLSLTWRLSPAHSHSDRATWRVFDWRRVCLESMMFKRDDLGCNYSGQRSSCKTVGKTHFISPVMFTRTALVQWRWRCSQSLSLLSSALLHASACTLPPALVKNSR